MPADGASRWIGMVHSSTGINHLFYHILKKGTKRINNYCIIKIIQL